MTFQVIIRGRNCEKWIGACLKALIAQTYTDWRATIILDAPTDGSEEIAFKFVKKKTDKIAFCCHTVHRGVAYNMYYGPRIAQKYWGFDDNSVIVIYDADDMLAPKALKRRAKKYIKIPHLQLTYGSFWRLDKKRSTKTSRMYDLSRNVRKQRWHGTHLKTFRYGLFKQIPEEYFKDDNGKWFIAASDLALMFPLFDMIGVDRYKTHTRFIKHADYLWRRTDQKTRGHDQKRAKKVIRAKKPLKRLEIL